MRHLLFSFCALLLISSACEVRESDSSREEKLEAVGTRAIVIADYADEGCKILLEIEEEGQKVLLMPIELDDKFKVHGSEVLIEYRLSRIMQSDCQKGCPIVIESIRFVE